MRKSDIYSFGIILWEISSGKPPFKSFELGVVLCAYIVQGHREKPVEGALPQYVELYEQCWDNDPDIRPDTESILETLNKLISPDTI
ncbi:kinase-like domain-containing protein, partial [Gigaspora rosea]